MANSRSALKRIKQSEKKRMRNKQVKTKVKNTIRSFFSTLNEDNQEAAARQLRIAGKMIDKAASKGVIPKKTAARKKSRLTKKLNQSRQAG